MNDVIVWTLLCGFALAGVSILAFAGLRGWQGWLDLKRAELAGRRGGPSGDRIEIADLRERIRKLEAIAACVDP